MIRYYAHPSGHPERTNIARPQLASLPESDHSFPRRYLQENIITDLKLELGSSPIRITFLAALSGQQSLPDPLYLLCRLKHDLCTTHHSLPNLSPTNGGPTPPTIQQLKGRHTNARMMAVVVGKLCQG